MDKTIIKRKHTTLTLNLKCKILEEIKQGVSARKLAEKYGIGNSTISDLKKNQKKIESFIANSPGDLSFRKTLKKAEHPAMEAMLYSWFISQKNKKTPISYEVLAQKAKLFYKKCYGKNSFAASRGWITNFKKRHGLRRLIINKEKAAKANTTVKVSFEKELTEKIQSLKLSPAQVYYVDESELYWKFLQDVFEEKEKITFLTCLNTDGTHKLHLFIVVKEQNLHDLSDLKFPIECEASSNGLMTSTLFTKWFYNSYTTQVEMFLKNRNIQSRTLLLVSNSLQYVYDKHLRSNGEEFSTILLPSNFTTFGTNSNQNSTWWLKNFYKDNLMSYISSFDEHNEDINEVLKRLKLRDGLGFLYDAWNRIHSNFCESWSDFLLNENSSLAPENVVVKQENLQEFSLLNPVTEVYVEENEFHNFIGEDFMEKREVLDEDEQPSTTIKKVDHKIAVENFDMCLQWAEQNGISLEECDILKDLETKQLHCLKFYFIVSNNNVLISVFYR